MKKRVNLAFVGLVLAGLLWGLVKTVFLPKDVNTYENRYANQVGPLTAERYLDGSFQDDLEAALNDQVSLSQYMKKLYNLASSQLSLALLKPVAREGRYYHWGDVSLYSDYLTYPPRDFEKMQPKLEERVRNYNEVFARFPDTEFYVYYIEKDTDVNFETGERVPMDRYLFQDLTLPEDHMAAFQVPDFETFSRDFYKTDHHWNACGSYRGYEELLTLLRVGDNPLVPRETVTLSSSFTGSKAAQNGLETDREDFIAYRFDFPPMTVTENGDPSEDYGGQEAFFSGLRTNPTYGSFYGGDDGELILDTGREDRENLLVIGESYDNAVAKLLASHFGKTYVVDLRNYETFQKAPFRLGEYLRKNGITKVLLMGNIDYFVSADFTLEG